MLNRVVNKAVNNSIFSCKGRKESFHVQNADVRYILDELWREPEFMNYRAVTAHVNIQKHFQQRFSMEKLY